MSIAPTNQPKKLSRVPRTATKRGRRTLMAALERAKSHGTKENQQNIRNILNGVDPS